MSDVAARAGVSQATVSFVLGGRADRLKISHETRERVLGVARDLGYQRNQLARAIVTGKSRIIGVLTTPESGDNIERMLTGVMEAASQHNYLLKVAHLSWMGIDDDTISRCLEWRLAGAVVVGFSGEAHQRLNEAFHKAKIPVAGIDNVPAVDWGARISSHDEQGIYDVIEHLVGLGHRNIAYIGGGPGPLSDWRARSFLSCMAGKGLSVPCEWIRHASWRVRRTIEEESAALFRESRNGLPTAAVCSSDGIAMVLIRTARNLGLRVPEDLSVTGYSNGSLSEFVDPPLTTVDQSFHAMGRAAALQIIGIAEGNDKADPPVLRQEMLLATHLIVRESTAPVPPQNQRPNPTRRASSFSPQ